MYVTVRLFSNRSQMTSKCGKNNKVAHEVIAECVTDVLTTFWRPLWPIIEQTHNNMVFYIIKKQTTTEKLFYFGPCQHDCPSLPQTQVQNGGRNSDSHVDFATWIQLKPCYAHAHGCTHAFLPPVIDAFSNFSCVVWRENILSVF